MLYLINPTQEIHFSIRKKEKMAFLIIGSVITILDLNYLPQNNIINQKQNQEFQWRTNTFKDRNLKSCQTLEVNPSLEGAT